MMITAGATSISPSLRSAFLASVCRWRAISAGHRRRSSAASAAPVWCGHGRIPFPSIASWIESRSSSAVFCGSIEAGGDSVVDTIVEMFW